VGAEKTTLTTQFGHMVSLYAREEQEITGKCLVPFKSGAAMRGGNNGSQKDLSEAVKDGPPRAEGGKINVVRRSNCRVSETKDVSESRAVCRFC